MPVFEVGTACKCVCSCFTDDTLIRLADGQDIRAKDLLEGQRVSTIGSTSGAVIWRVIKSSVKSLPLKSVAFSDGTSIAVSSNHVFISSDHRILRADKLKSGDKVLDGVLGAKIVNEISGTDYTGNLYNVVISNSSAAPYDHLIITNGILSGDFSLQATNDRDGRDIDLFLANISVIKFDSEE